MLCQEISSLVEKDLKTIWHPFAKTKKIRDPIPIVRGKKALLYSEDGQCYIDAISSWWVNLHGHCQPHISQAIYNQSQELEHVIFTDFTHIQAVTYAERLLKWIGSPFSRVFYTDNGSTAVEAALKMAIQYFKNLKLKKKKILSLKGGYHGDTFGAMSTGSLFNQSFLPYLFEVVKIGSIDEMKEALKDDDVICFIYEPLLQGSCGMRFHTVDFLEPLLELARAKGVLLIADEVLTGFGRLGPLFASSLLKTKPDLICLAKGISGGFLPLGAVVTHEKIYESFFNFSFYHGHSYTANPLAIAAANASLDLTIQSENQRDHIAQRHSVFCQKWKKEPALKRIESMGTVLAIEYFQPPTSDFFLSHHILMRPLENVFYVIAPYCIEDEELDKIYETLEMTWKNK